MQKTFKSEKTLNARMVKCLITLFITVSSSSHVWRQAVSFYVLFKHGRLCQGHANNRTELPAHQGQNDAVLTSQICIQIIEFSLLSQTHLKHFIMTRTHRIVGNLQRKIRFVISGVYPTWQHLLKFVEKSFSEQWILIGVLSLLIQGGFCFLYF